MNVQELMEKKKGHAFAHLQEQFWLEIIETSLSITNGNCSKAAYLLGINKATYYNWCKRLGIEYTTYQKGGISKEHAASLLATLRSSKSISQTARRMGVHTRTITRQMETLGYSKSELGAALCSK